MIKKVLSLIIVMVIALSSTFFCFAYETYNNPDVIFSMSATEVKNNKFTLSLKLESQKSRDIGGMLLVIMYDQKLVKSENSRGFVVLPQADVGLSEETGQISLIWEDTKSALNNEEILIAVDFTVIAEGGELYPVKFNCVELYDNTEKLENLSHDFDEEIKIVRIAENPREKISTTAVIILVCSVLVFIFSAVLLIITFKPKPQKIFKRFFIKKTQDLE